MRGLSGDQGVIIPAANVRHLALKEEVVRAVEVGQFHVWAIHTVDEGIEILTGIGVGEADPDGRYPDDSVHGRVDGALRQCAERFREFGAGARDSARHNGRKGVSPSSR